MTVPVHYDVMMGEFHWRELITRGLRGADAEFWEEAGVLAGYGEFSSRLFTTLLEYAKNGQQVFHVGPVMQELFDECLLTEVPATHIRLPYKCFYVVLPDCPWFIWGGNRTQWHRVAGVYVREIRQDIWHLTFWGQANERSTTVDDDATFWCDLGFREAPHVEREGVPFYDLEAYCTTLLNHPSTFLTGLDPPSMPPDWDQHKETLRHVWRVIFNLLLYLNSDRPDLQRGQADEAERKALQRKLGQKKSGSKVAKVRRQLDRLSQATITWVGQGIERRSREAQADTGRTVRLHRRRGHRHAYWVGPRRDAEGNPRLGDTVVIKFVAPMWVGAKEAGEEYPGRQYHLDTERGES